MKAMLALVSALSLMSAPQEIREVTLTFKPKRAAKSVAVAGDFNHWDKSRDLMQLGSDGSWSLRLPLEPGVYQYRFVIDGSRWEADPSAPTKTDANGTLNSVLVLEPESFAGKPAKEGDGIVTEGAFLHRPNGPDTVRRSQGEAVVRFRTRTGDVESVAWLVDGEEVPMEKVSETPLFTTWQARGKSADVGYRFSVKDGTTTVESGPYKTLWSQTPLPNPPAWLEDAVFYQIFPDRFADGDTANNDSDGPAWGTVPAPRGRMGGDLAGVGDRLAHLRSLGVNAVYFNPLFKAGTYHSYDTEDYFKIDPHFGDNAGFKALAARLQALGVRVVLDAVFNHVGTSFAPFKDVVEKGEESEHKDWFHVLSWPLEVAAGQRTYRGWAGHHHLPKLDTTNSQVQEYLDSVAVFWIQQAKIDGWRLDVADEVDPGYWRQFRQAVKKANPEAVILGEVWGDAHAWVQGDQHDTVTNYPWREAVLSFFGRGGVRPSEFDRQLRLQRDWYPEALLRTTLNLLGSHDTARIRTALQGDRSKLRQAVLFQMLAPGVPCVYYGDEVGMEGGSDPDCRRGMDWSEKSWDKEFLWFYRDAIALRKASKAVRKGSTRTLLADDRQGLYAVERRLGDERTVMVFNVSDRPTNWGGDAIDGLRPVIAERVKATRRGLVIEPRGCLALTNAPVEGWLDR